MPMMKGPLETDAQLDIKRLVRDEPRTGYEDDEVSKSWHGQNQEDMDIEWKEIAEEIEKDIGRGDISECGSTIK